MGRNKKDNETRWDGDVLERGFSIPSANSVDGIVSFLKRIADGHDTISKISEVVDSSVGTVQGYVEACWQLGLIGREKKEKGYRYFPTKLGMRVLKASDWGRKKILQEVVFSYPPFRAIASYLKGGGRDIGELGEFLRDWFNASWSEETYKAKARVLLSWGTQLNLFRKYKKNKGIVIYELGPEGRRFLERERPFIYTLKTSIRGRDKEL